VAVDVDLSIRGVGGLFQTGERHASALAVLAVTAEDVGPDDQAELTEGLLEVQVGCGCGQVGYKEMVVLLIKF